MSVSKFGADLRWASSDCQLSWSDIGRRVSAIRRVLIWMQMQKSDNRFANFADADEVKAEQVHAPKAKAQEKPKKQVIRVQKNNDNAPKEGDEFQAVADKQQAAARGSDNRRGGDRRGGRGGRGGERGGRGGERGGRPRTAAVDGEEGAARVERAERGGERKRFEGKAREDAHPMDRQDGTGRGRRGDRKGGAASKGNWGDNKKADGADGEEPRERRERKPREPREPREKKEHQHEEEKKPEPVVEEEEVGFTLDDYMVQKKTDGLKKNEVRKHAKIDDKNVKENANKDTSLFAATPEFSLAGNQTHKQSAGAGAELLGFGNVNYDDDFRGPRGADRPQQRPAQRGGRKGGKLVVNDNEFPTL